MRQRPQTSKAQEEPEGESDDDDAEPDRMPETQLDDISQEIDNEDDTNEPGVDYDPANQTTEPTNSNQKSDKKKEKSKSKKPSPDTKAPGKKKAVDHANYRRLNIKNKNSKANGRRFGRRR